MPLHRQRHRVPRLDNRPARACTAELEACSRRRPLPDVTFFTTLPTYSSWTPLNCEPCITSATAGRIWSASLGAHTNVPSNHSAPRTALPLCSLAMGHA